jgi:integrase
LANAGAKWAPAARLRHCIPHGLRKASATRAAENGATTSQLTATFGWQDIKQAEHYTRKVVQKNLAGSAMGKLVDGSKTQTNVSHFQSRAKKRGKESGEGVGNQPFA